jgi:hypothetical protein
MKIEIRRQSFNGFSSGIPGSGVGETYRGYDVVVDGVISGSYRDEREAEFARQTMMQQQNYEKTTVLSCGCAQGG